MSNSQVIVVTALMITGAIFAITLGVVLSILIQVKMLRAEMDEMVPIVVSHDKEIHKRFMERGP